MEQTQFIQSKEPVNILVTIDSKYIFPLSVMLTSYGALHFNIETNLYIAHSSLTEKDFSFLQSVTENYKIKIHDIFIKEQWFTDTPVLERLPEESFYRLLAFHFLPKEVHRCLYLDPDILIKKSLLSLYYTEIGNYYIMAASHTYTLKNKFNLLRLGIPSNDRYFNSGVMLMNLDAIRKNFTIDSILITLKKNIHKLWLGDQDLINILFGYNALLIDERIYNLDERTFKHYKKTFALDQVQNLTAIIHYNGKYKPWLEGYKGKLDMFYPQIAAKGDAPTGKWKEQIQALYSIACANSSTNLFLISILGMLTVCIFFWSFFGKELVNIITEPQIFHKWLAQFGIFDELIFIFIRAIQTIAKIIPAIPLEIASGYIWGAIPGMLFCVIGNIIGTLIILFITRYFKKNLIERPIFHKHTDMLAAFQNSHKVYILLFFVYLCPGLPKDGLTYIFGLLPIKIVPFIAITFIARIPSVLSYTLCGATLAGEHYFISGLLFIITIIFAFVGGFIYKKHLKARTITCKTIY